MSENWSDYDEVFQCPHGDEFGNCEEICKCGCNCNHHNFDNLSCNDCLCEKFEDNEFI